MDTNGLKNIEQKVQDHIAELNRNQLLSESERDELFDHFLTTISTLTKNDLSAKEAFEVAKIRFGSVQDFRKEYKKVRPLKAFYHHVMFALLIYFGVYFLCGLAMVLGMLALFLTTKFNLGLELRQTYLMLTIMLLPLLLLSFYGFKKMVERKKSISIQAIWILGLIVFTGVLGRRIYAVYQFKSIGGSMNATDFFFQLMLGDYNMIFSIFSLVLLIYVWVKIRRDRYLALA